jgi:hypothetical protein
MKRYLLGTARLAALFSCVLAGCAGSSGYLCRPDPATGSSSCQMASSSPGNAALVTGVAAGVFAVTGCTVNGCEFPYTCNQQSKRCERMQCNEHKPCPGGYNCDPVSLRCI